jgi:hypothetical protein
MYLDIEASKGVEPVIRVRFEWNFFGEEDFTAGLGTCDN